MTSITLPPDLGRQVKDTRVPFEGGAGQVEHQEEENSSRSALIESMMIRGGAVGPPKSFLGVWRPSLPSDLGPSMTPRRRPSGPAESTNCPPWMSSTRTPRTCLVFLIRHGEASHNVLEKQATQRAKEEGEAQGLPPEEILDRMEEARKAVLFDEDLRDAGLSELGQKDAMNSRTRLETLLRENQWTMPGKVLVSPLTRTLQTADIIFHQHDSIYVHEEIQERRTGQPCDSRQSSVELSKIFGRFRMHAMKSFLHDSMFLSVYDDETNDDSSSSSSSSSVSSQGELLRGSFRRWSSEGHYARRGPPTLDQSLEGGGRRWHQMTRALSEPVKHLTEDKSQLRQRTRQLLTLLDGPSIAVVTHKGYLRELERGTLGQPNAVEFSNGEIRVYRIHLNDHQELEKATRVV